MLSGCAPEFWNAYAQALSGQAYAPSNSGSRNTGANTVKVCVKYETQAGWSQGYQVSGDLLKGSELNSRTGTFGYDAFATYVVVFWGDGQASILKLAAFFGSLGPYPIDAQDQEGRHWQVSTGDYCY